MIKGEKWIRKIQGNSKEIDKVQVEPDDEIGFIKGRQNPGKLWKKGMEGQHWRYLLKLVELQSVINS